MMVTAAWESKLSHPSGDFEFSPLAQVGEVTVRLLRLRRGKADPVITTRDVGLWDGSLEELVRHENRDVELLVVFDGPDSDALAVKEEELALQVRKGRQDWTWTPPDGVGATTVFDVLWGDLELVDDDDLWDVKEILGKRVWRLKLRCRPFGRGTDLQTTTAGGGSNAASTQINACDSLTGWTADPGCAIALDSTYKAEGTNSIRLTGAVSYELTNAYWNVYKRTEVAGATLSGLSQNFSTTPYLTVKVQMQYAIETPKVRLWVDGVEATAIGAPAYVATTGFATFSFRSVDSSASSIRIEVTKVTQAVIPPGGVEAPQGGPAALIYIDDTRKGVNAASASSTGREITSMVPILGSARTEATIAVSHPTNGLGDVFVYTSPELAVAGYTPDLSRYCTTKAGSASNPISGSAGGGSLATSAGTTVFQIPAATLPEGSYLLYVAGAGGGSPTGTITVVARLKVGSTVLAERTYTLTASRLSPADTFAVLGQLNLPPAAVPEASAAVVELDVYAAASFLWDEFFLCHLSETHAITVVKAGGTGTAALGTANNRLWIDPPSIDRPAGGVYLGTDVTRADAYHAGAAAAVWSQHRAEPPSLAVFVANTGGQNPVIEASHFDRVLFHAVRRS